MIVNTSLLLPTKDKDLSILDLGGLVTSLVNPNRDLVPQFLSLGSYEVIRYLRMGTVE